MIRVVIFLLFVGLLYSCGPKMVSQSNAASDKKASSLNPESNLPGPQQYNKPAQERFLFFFKRKSKLNWGDQLIAEYKERMKDNAKAAKKKARKMEKPQYSDPSYFGHKRKPKKRPPGKMKFCEECGIKH
ncbi:MAG: hypothetical protein ACJAT1_001674 [Marivirga sp.]|jgi:hypothetical protein